ncbi:MAG: hypothetical protein KF831_17345, partial [Acidobacteria bacterium]|nr:hypothetical protein [Acidobacteriota bacterium]
TPFVVTSGGSSCVGCGMLDETMPLWALGGEPRITHNGFPISHEEAAMMADAGNLAMEIVHAARGRIDIFRNVPVGGILGNLVMPSHYRLLRSESNQGAIEITGSRFIDNTIASLSDCVSQLLTVNNNRSNPIAQETREKAMAAILVAASEASMIVEQLAYALATAEVETTYFTALRETFGKPPPFGTKEALEWTARQAPYFNKKYDGIIGNISGTNDGFIFRGGGYVQLTGRENYARFGLDETNVDSVTNPSTAARILVQGLLNGTFTKGEERIGTYINGRNTDFYNARKVVNGNELKTKPSKVSEIERFANRYLRALKQCR